MKSIHSLFVMTPEIWAHSHVSPLTPLLQLVNDFTWRLHTRKIHESLGDHSSLRNVMWMEFDWLKRRSRIVSRLNGSVLNCFNRWCHLLLPALPWHQCHCHVHTMQHHFIHLFFHSCTPFFISFPHLQNFQNEKRVNGCFQQCMSVRQIMTDYFYVAVFCICYFLNLRVCI